MAKAVLKPKLLAWQRMPLMFPALAWVLGLVMARIERVPLDIEIMFVVLLMLCVAVRWHRLFCVWMLLGLLWGTVILLNDARQSSFDASWLRGVISLQASIEQVNQQSHSMRLRLYNVRRDDGVKLAGKLDVYVWGRGNHRLQAGQKVALKAKLHAPYNHQNPAGFDYEAYAFNRYIALIGGVKGSIKVLNEDVGFLNDLRAKVRASLPSDNSDHAGQAGILKALLLAERDAIPNDVQDAFAATGTAHLLAISGLHVGMVAAWGAMLCWWFLTRREAWIVRFPVRHVSITLGVLCAVLYATLAGWPLPTQRAALMLGAAALAWWLRARYEPVNILLAALMLILLWDAGAVTSVSLWLSFVATLALVLFAKGESEGQGWSLSAYLKALVGVSVVAGLATLPLIADVFGRLPVWSLAANILLVPLYGIWVLPLALMGEISAVLGFSAWAEMLMMGSAYGIQVGNICLMEIQHWPAGNLWLPKISWLWSMFYAFGILAVTSLWLMLYRRWAISLMFVVLIFYGFGVVSEKGSGKPMFVAWDVGQGAAASLTQAMDDGSTHVMVVDVPGRKGDRFNGGTTVAAGLRSMGLTHVDVLMLSHAQSDHAGGAWRLLDSIRNVSELWLADVPANHVYAPILELIQRIKRSGGGVRWLKQGDVLNIGQASLHVLWPPQGYVPDNDNNTSLVCSIVMPDGTRFLISGDMEKSVEQALLQQGLLTPHDMMLMPHHGSRTSSTHRLVKQLQPRIAIAQTGYKNHFGFPKEDVVQRYKNVGSKVWNTAQGAVMWEPRKQGKVQQFHGENSEKRRLALQWVEFFL